MTKIEERLKELEARLVDAEAKAAKYDKYTKINKDSYARRLARIAIIQDKAAKAGIVCTPAEEDAWMAKHPRKTKK